MRDRRFVAVHRGGPLGVAEHRLLATWAADCAEHVLPLFEASSHDDRPQRAVELARAWAKREITVGEARSAAVAAHAAAREATDAAAIAVARATAHAVATAHMADHCLGAAVYGLKSVAAAGTSMLDERTWQNELIPDSVRALVLSALASERFACWSPKSAG